MPDVTVQTAGTTTTTTTPPPPRTTAAVRTLRTPSLFRGILRCDGGGDGGRGLVFAWMQTGDRRGGGGGGRRGSSCIHITRLIVVTQSRLFCPLSLVLFCCYYSTSSSRATTS